MIFLFSYQLSPKDIHVIFTPFRIYYRFTRWLYGDQYNPFETKLKHGHHPVLIFLKRYQSIIRTFYHILQFVSYCFQRILIVDVCF